VTLSLLLLDPVIFQLGPFQVRWYGVLMALSVAVGFYFLLRGGRRLGYDDDFLYNLLIISVLGGVVGARAVYVATNWEHYATNLAAVIRTDWGGLSFHGAVIGGVLSGGWYIKKKKASFGELADLVVPGFTTGIMLVRLANILNMEVVGRVTSGGFQHPAQLYGSAIGLILLIIYVVMARRRPPAGYLFWSFALYYSVLRGFIEETVRANPLYITGFNYEPWGIAGFTLVQLLTPIFIAFSWWMRRRTVQGGALPAHHNTNPRQHPQRNAHGSGKKGKGK
jgi:phosphatidylglycerol:prolipoprotein diacylglycerol transferase